MKIGEPKREIYVEPIELPEPLRTEQSPEAVPVETPVEEPVEDGVGQRIRRQR